MIRSVEDIVAALVRRHAGREVFTSIFEEGEAPDLPFAYAVQDRYVEEIRRGGSPDIAGYKIGLTNVRMQQMCGVPEPISGVVLASRIRTSPAKVACGDFVRLGVESEIAVQVGEGIADLAPGSPTPPLASLIDRACAAFELVEDSAADYGRLSAVSIVADNSWNAGLVLGPTVPGSQLDSLAGREGVLYRNGEASDRGSSSDVLGDPMNVVFWLADHLRHRGRSLRPGQWVSTGTIAPTVFVAPGEKLRFEVAGLPPVELEAN